MVGILSGAYRLPDCSYPWRVHVIRQTGQETNYRDIIEICISGNPIRNQFAMGSLLIHKIRELC
jgi:hypothetical protein